MKIFDNNRAETFVAWGTWRSWKKYVRYYAR